MRVKQIRKACSISLAGVVLVPVVAGLMVAAMPLILLDYCRKKKKDKTTYNKGRK